jgi:hypothetical protein
MKTYLFVEDLTFISDRLRQVFERHRNGAAACISFKEIQQFQKQLRTWERGFIKPPLPFVTACDLERLCDFYRHQLDFSIFQGFNREEREIIQEEISAYVAREALDTRIGCRLRNWAAIGLQHPKWQLYQERVRAYYEQTVSPGRRDRIAMIEQAVVQQASQTPEEIHARCVGELFFEVDRIRLMPSRTVEGHLESIRLQSIEREERRSREPQRPDVPEALQSSFQLLGLTHPADFDELKTRYRQLALSYHPDKGGSLEMMQRLNLAYRRIADYLRQIEAS